MREITGIILSGGKSSRMGGDKAFLPFPVRPLIEITLANLSGLFAELIIVANKLEPYLRYGVKTVADIVPERGPLGGIYTGLLSSDTMYNFIVACDMPFINQDLIRYMVQRIDDFDVVIPMYNDRFEPLCAVYSKKCIKSIEEELSKGNLKIRDFFQQAKVKTISQKEIVKFDPQGLSFKNINTPEDHKKFKCAGI